MGNYKVYVPDAGTSVVALYAHGESDHQRIAKQSVKLGYYTAHGQGLEGTVAMAGEDPPFPADKDENLQDIDEWESYELTPVSELRDAEETLSTVDSIGVAIAYVISTTHTADIVSQLAGQGFTEIRGVHCRNS
jgi:hypothetical protein